MLNTYVVGPVISTYVISVFYSVLFPIPFKWRNWDKMRLNDLSNNSSPIKKCNEDLSDPKIHVDYSFHCAGF
jgi:hypothetical protein